MFCRRHIDQNVFGRLLSMGIKEEGASMLVNTTWHNLINSSNLTDCEERLKNWRLDDIRGRVSCTT